MTTFKFEQFKKNNNIINFKIKNIDIGLLNSIRRTILSEIENVAFDFEPYKTNDSLVNIIKNTSPLHNEFIKHRLSLIPLCFDANEINDFDNTKYKFVLQKRNTTTDLMDVHTGDFEIYDTDNKKYSSTFRDKIFPKNPITKDYILITKLKPNLIKQDEGNEIYIEAYATKDIAKNYSGFGLVSTCTYFNIVDEDYSKEILNNKIKELKKNNTLTTKEEIEEFKKDFNNLEKHKYFYKNEYDEANYFDFTIESECRISPEYLFFKALTILNNKINKIIEKIIKEEIKFKYLNNTDDIYEIIIENEKHTIGNLIQVLCYNKFIREENKELIKYIGYRCPHPLENQMFIRIQLNSDNKDFKDKTYEIKEKLMNKIFINACEDIQTYLTDINKTWLKFCKIDKNYSSDIRDF